MTPLSCGERHFYWVSGSDITTLGITTLHRFSIVQEFNQGQLESYDATELRGTAAFVAFVATAAPTKAA